MEDPENEVVPLIRRLTTANSPSALRADIEANFLPTAGFRHPLCYTEPAPRSRDAIIAIYSHYRSISPHTTSDARVLAYDKQKNILVVETVQQFHLFFSPFKTAPARLVTNLVLAKDEHTGLHFIAFQEDFYHPDHFFNLLVPPLARVIRYGLWWGTVASGLLAPVGSFFGLFAEPPQQHSTKVNGIAPRSNTDHSNPVHIVGRALKTVDGIVRARGVQWSRHDVVRAVPGDEQLLHHSD